jgi:hypothetical protein
MDILGELNVQWYSRKRVTAFLANNRMQQSHKKFTELRVGWLLAEHMYSNGRVETMIGFPLVENHKLQGTEAGYEIEQLISNPDLIRDTDFDIFLALADRIAPPRPVLRKIEITRIVPRPQQLPLTWQSVASTIDKKLLRQRDETIWLVVNVEERLHLELDPLNQHIESCQVPYGYVYLLGAADESLRKFKVFELYPDMGEYGEYEIPLVGIK